MCHPDGNRFSIQFDLSFLFHAYFGFLCGHFTVEAKGLTRFQSVKVSFRVIKKCDRFSFNIPVIFCDTLHFNFKKLDLLNFVWKYAVQL